MFAIIIGSCVSFSTVNFAPNLLIQNTDTLNIPMDLDSAYTHYTNQMKSPLFEGYTIHIFSGNREGANAERANIISMGAEDKSRIVYKEPNFKVYVGSYPDISSAERALVGWKSSYPEAFVLKTLVPWYPINLDNRSAPSDTANIEP